MDIKIVNTDEIESSDLNLCIYRITISGWMHFVDKMLRGKTIRALNSDDDLPKNILIKYSHRDEGMNRVVLESNIPDHLISPEVKKYLIYLMENYIKSVRSSTNSL